MLFRSGLGGANDENEPLSGSASIRTSISSASMQNSRYSTPLTTAPGTPLASFSENKNTRASLGLKAETTTQDPIKAAIYNSMASSSRSRPSSSKPEADDEDDKENADARLARQLQDEENSKMEIDSEEDIAASSRLSRKVKRKQPARSLMQFSDMSDLSDIDTDSAPEPSRSPPAHKGAFASTSLKEIGRAHV